MSFVPDEPAVMEVCSRGGKLFFNMSTQVTAGNQFEKKLQKLAKLVFPHRGEGSSGTCAGQEGWERNLGITHGSKEPGERSQQLSSIHLAHQAGLWASSSSGSGGQQSPLHDHLSAAT